MIEWLLDIFPALDSNANLILMIGVGIGMMLFVYGAFDALTPANPAARRYRRNDATVRRTGFDAGILYNPEVDPKGLMKALMPVDRNERSRLKRDLRNAGFVGQNAILRFFSLRVGLAIGLPMILVLLVVIRRSGLWMPADLIWLIDATPRLVMLQIITALAGIGFFAPAWWLKRNVRPW